MSDSEFADGFLQGASNGLAVGNLGASLDIARNVNQMAQDAIADSNKLHQANIAANSAEIKVKTAARLLKIANDRIDELEQELELEKTLHQATRQHAAMIAATPDYAEELRHCKEVDCITQQLNISEAQILEWMIATKTFRKLTIKLADEAHIPKETLNEMIYDSAIAIVEEDPKLENTEYVRVAREKKQKLEHAPK